MTQILLHIGSHKTGTTAIQTFASQNKDLLKAGGVLYPSFDLIGGPRERSHLGMIKRIIQGCDLPKTENPMAMLSKAREIAESEGLDILISAESMFRLDVETAQKVIETLNAAFEKSHFVVLCSLRTQAEFAESLYRNQFRDYDKVPDDFPVWLEKARRNFDYESIIKRYAEPLKADLRVRPYSKNTRDGFVADFFRNIGIEPGESRRPAQEKNPSLDVTDCIAKNRVMQGSTDKIRSTAFNDFAFKDRIQTEYGFLDRTKESMFMESFIEANMRLVAMAPELESVLCPQVEQMSLSPIDESCLKVVSARASAFEAKFGSLV